MLVEIFGLPGTGKTTVSVQLARERKLEYIATRLPFERYLYAARFLLTKPILFIRLFIKTISESGRQWLLMQHKLHILASYIVRAEKGLARARTKAVLLDEGLAQYGLSLHEHELTREEAEEYVKRYIKADVLILLTASPDIREQRMTKRGFTPRSHIGKGKDWFELLQNNMKTFTDVLTGPRFFVVDNNGADSTEAVREIAKIIEQHQV